MPAKSDFQIRNEKLPERCEICHQADQFDPQTGVCLRCQNLPQPPVSENLRTAIRFRFLQIGMLLFLAGSVGLGLVGLLFLSHSWIWCGMAGFLGIWGMGWISLDQSSRRQKKKTTTEKAPDSSLEPTPITLAVVVPWVATYRKLYESVAFFFMVLGMIGIPLVLLSTAWQKGSYPTSQDTTVFAPQEHYYFTDHGKQIEVTRLRYVLNGFLIFGSWHCFTMAFALMMIQKLAYEKPLGKPEEGKSGNPYSKASP
ncbi:MAG: hypothetical protein K1Y36_19765 [Blastocatellia bacterium]|nr:hypothetical protein [Blastocatellia bacterium]